MRSPIDGRVSNARVTPGNLVTSSDVLTSVVSVNPVYVYFDVDEQTWLKLDHLRADAKQAGRSARIEASMGLADESGHPHHGRLDFVDNQLHTGSGTIRLRAVFDNADGLYTPGLYARVQLQSGPARSRVLVDDRAIGTDLGNQFVYVVDKQHKVQYRKVEHRPAVSWPARDRQRHGRQRRGDGERPAARAPRGRGESAEGGDDIRAWMPATRRWSMPFIRTMPIPRRPARLHQEIRKVENPAGRARNPSLPSVSQRDRRWAGPGMAGVG